MLGILSAGIAPGFALLSYFYLKEEYEKEPISKVLQTFIFGALLVLPIMFIQHVIQVENLIHSEAAAAFLSSSLLEEFCKWFILYISLSKLVKLNEPFEGIVYGVSVSLGFATVENILYLIGNGIEHALTRALLPVSSHAIFGVIMGFYMGKSKFSVRFEYMQLLFALLIPFILHGLYDFILLSQEYWPYLILPFMIFLWWIGLRKVKIAKVVTT